MCPCIFLLFYPHFKDWPCEYLRRIFDAKTNAILLIQEAIRIIFNGTWPNRHSVWCCFCFCMRYAHPSFRVWISFAIHIFIWMIILKREKKKRDRLNKFILVWYSYPFVNTYGYVAYVPLIVLSIRSNWFMIWILPFRLILYWILQANRTRH